MGMACGWGLAGGMKHVGHKGTELVVGICSMWGGGCGGDVLRAGVVNWAGLWWVGGAMGRAYLGGDRG